MNWYQHPLPTSSHSTTAYPASSAHQMVKNGHGSCRGCYHRGDEAPSVDPRLSALYVEIDKLVGNDGPKKYIIEWLTKETKKAASSELKVLSIVTTANT